FRPRHGLTFVNTHSSGCGAQHLGWKVGMTQRQGTSWVRITGLAATCFAAALLLEANVVSAGPGSGNGNGDQDPGYKGTASLDVVAVPPSPGRCGNAPNMELTFEGCGLDTAGGITSIESPACQNLATGE